jgi:hypothetical protein
LTNSDAKPAHSLATQAGDRIANVRRLTRTARSISLATGAPGSKLSSSMQTLSPAAFNRGSSQFHVQSASVLL